MSCIIFTNYNKLALALEGTDILKYWRDHAYLYPVLSRIARDILATATSGVGVESLFNSVRDICHYRRSRLSPDTIEALVIMMCTDRFTIDKDFQQLLDEISVDNGLGSESSDDIDIGEPAKYISDTEDAGGLEEAETDESEDDEDGRSLPPVRVLSRNQASTSRTTQASTPSTRRSCRTAHSPGHFRLVNR
jgi:hypothetical protein